MLSARMSSALTADSLALTLGVSLEEAQKIIEDSLAAEPVSTPSDRCDASVLSSALGISQEDARQLIEQNKADSCDADQLAAALGISKGEAEQLIKQNVTTNLNADEISSVLEISKQEAERLVEQNKARLVGASLNVHSGLLSEDLSFGAAAATEAGLGRCDSDALSSALGISKEEARQMIAQNIMQLSTPSIPESSPEKLAAELGLPEDEVKTLISLAGGAGHAAGHNRVTDEDSDLAYAVQVQDEMEADARLNEHAQQARDAALSAELSEPEYECLACMDVFKVSQLYTVDCPSSHRFCFDDIRRHVDGCLQRRQLAACPLCTDPPHRISETEVRQLFGRGAQLDALLDASLRDALAGADDVVACPTPDCPEYLVLSTRLWPSSCVRTCVRARARACVCTPRPQLQVVAQLVRRACVCVWVGGWVGGWVYTSSSAPGSGLATLTTGYSGRRALAT
jgi:DNA-directed RNA polymerase specialized sigma subunit